MGEKSKEVVIVSAIRTPIGTYKGSLKNIRSDQLGSIVINEVLKRSEFSKDEIDEVSFNSWRWTKSRKTSCNKCWHTHFKTITFNKSSLWIRTKSGNIRLSIY